MRGGSGQRREVFTLGSLGRGLAGLIDSGIAAVETAVPRTEQARSPQPAQRSATRRAWSASLRADEEGRGGTIGEEELPPIRKRRSGAHLPRMHHAVTTNTGKDVRIESWTRWCLTECICDDTDK